jgi:hypothetical protein
MANMLPTLQAFVNQNLSEQQAAESLSAIALDPSALTLANDGSRTILNVIDGTHNRHVVHNPSYGFAGAGWKIEYPEKIDLSHGEGAFLHMRKGNPESGALCFFDDEKRQFPSAISYWLRTSLPRLTLGASGDEPAGSHPLPPRRARLTRTGETGRVAWNRIPVGFDSGR